MDGAMRIIKFGKKAIYLPKFTIALLRTPSLSPYHARFSVPLTFSKFDLRDYLFHAYNVRALSIRSSIKQQPLRDQNDAPRKWFRPEAQKYMTIEMDQPFVWPERPESMKPWGRGERKKEINSAAEEQSKSQKGEKRTVGVLRRQALSMLRGGKTEVVKGEKKEFVDMEPGLRGWEKRRTNKIFGADEGEYKIRV